MELVVALLMYLGDPPVLKEHLLMPSLSECLKRKRISMRSTNNAQFQCMKVNAVIKEGKIITLLIGVMLALAGWTLTRTFDLSTNQAVQLDKVAKLEAQVEKLKDQMDQMMDSDKEIMEQHMDIFKMLKENNKPTTGYN